MGGGSMWSTLKEKFFHLFKSVVVKKYYFIYYKNIPFLPQSLFLPAL